MNFIIFIIFVIIMIRMRVSCLNESILLEWESQAVGSSLSGWPWRAHTPGTLPSISSGEAPGPRRSSREGEKASSASCQEVLSDAQTSGGTKMVSPEGGNVGIYSQDILKPTDCAKDLRAGQPPSHGPAFFSLSPILGPYVAFGISVPQITLEPTSLNIKLPSLHVGITCLK